MGALERATFGSPVQKLGKNFLSHLKPTVATSQEEPLGMGVGEFRQLSSVVVGARV